MALKTPLLTALLLGAALTAAHGAASGQPDGAATAARPQTDARAVALLGRVARRMGVIRSLSASARETITRGGAGAGQRALVKTTRLRLLRPNSARIDLVWRHRPASPGPAGADVPETFAADGRTAWRLWGASHELTTWPSDPAGEDVEKDLPGPLRGFFDKDLRPTAFLAALGKEHLVRRVQYLGEQARPDGRYRVVRLEYQKAGTSVIETDDYWVGRDLLIHHLTCAWGDAHVQADLTGLTINPPATREAFAYTPPPDAKISLATPMPQDAPRAVGTPAPDFTVSSAAGAALHLSDFRGEVVVLDFWATWCGNCLQEFPGENVLAGQYAAQGVVVLAVDVCDAPDVFRRWIAKHPEYPALRFALDPQGIDGRGINTTLYPGASLPTQYVIDRAGKLAAAISGYDGDAKESVLEAAIRKACATP